MIVPQSRLAIKDYPIQLWHELAVYWDAVGFDVEWQRQDSSLEELEVQLRRASVVVGVDTGPLHLADYMGIPVVGLYGATQPSFHGPLGNRSQVLHNPQGVSRIETRAVVNAVKQIRSISY